ncbi:bifunctional methylenetetrahydrofolate dehydrogenase/methenyltetrahydrofolate cyclohydrolase FolD [Pradoshia sp. D12]|uniref:bifunctional methylenetetrahydrofolate dehydrogenase/methenyltetrahydrofolate cyclohydrolase FolD n=1 Tax=Bacillaceae TaxID=186817 RepID=UPI00112B090A|nr:MULTISPECIES: bifunctional methylenetetrahydrofolate dehydrogenase/methenyltetrahydrofolate cyclohydrolase FolD [Bacillaceae]QFK72135.1 bifunctional methylenetetrahydrofolate dehydrogenase/methenyltetrahydrofolate cyclohydrolase FolD [Pradoshia sp. D12]TPF71373.1 bifunctional methylenetetrahydrofolate dehydrogenase/methenyltetrahydrofolate cyclohydrolase FolD [Bacillus sp. D12]
MPAQILNGKSISATIREEIASEVELLKENGIIPGLAVILVGDDQASQTYVRNKEKACEQLAMKSELITYPASISEDRLLDKLVELNHRPDIHGILVQLPLPGHIDEKRVIETIDPAKDVDGFHPINIGRMMTKQEALMPCTPFGILKMVQKTGIEIAGKHVVVVGRSNIVGKPVGQLFLNENATVTYCHSKTVDLRHFTKQADILIAAVGIAKMIKADDIKEGAIVIDVGMNRDESNKLCGDVDFDDVIHKASYITPVPGGVGPMTITMLMYNTVQVAKKSL